MTIKLHHLRPAPGSKSNKIRVGRGEGGKRGKMLAQEQRRRRPAPGVAGGDGVDDLRRRLSYRAALRLARSHQQWARGLEYRHHLQSGRGAELWPGRTHGA